MKCTIENQPSGWFRFLSRADLDILIYMTGDIWITPELKRFKNEIIKKTGGKR